MKSKSSKEPLNECGLYDYAVKALGRRMRTEAELRRLMRTRVEPGSRGDDVIKAVIARLKEQRYLDDRSYAETYARLRKENEKFGQRRVSKDLRQKGVAAGLVEKTLAESFAKTDEEKLAREHLERGLAVGRREDVVAVPLEDARHDPADRGAVIDDQDAARHGFRGTISETR